MIKIVKAAERLALPPKINIALFGSSGVGKTTQARTLDPASTLFLDLEAGMLAVADWPGDSIDIRKVANELGWHPWDVCRALVCFIAGPDPADLGGIYSRASYEQLKGVFGDPADYEKYKTIFIDSITVASRHSFQWSQLQPQAVSEKTGKPDTRGAYGLHGQEMIRWLTQIQHSDRSTIVVGILDEVTDDLKRTSYTPQIEGGKTGRELPGIFDQVVTLANLKTPEGVPYRAFICHLQNPWGFPAKDRSGCLDMIEKPDLGELMAKIRSGKRLDGTINNTLPSDKKEDK
jgi:hypothetical protein